MRLLKAIFLFLCLAALGGGCAEPKPVRALIVTGQNNHNWPVSSLVLKQILENSGRFTVGVATSPAQGEDMSGFAPDFAAYDVVVLDYMGDRWPAGTEQRFVEYAKNGGGIIVYHAANNAFPDWPAYNEICALGGWNGRDENAGPYVYWQDSQLVRDPSPGKGGAHGRQHEYLVNMRDADHPVTKGLPTQWFHAKDELYDRMRGPGNLETLLCTAWSDPETRGSGREEPLVFTVDYGAARIFHIMLGHAGPSPEDNPAMQCAGFQTLLLRGAEWAATGWVTQQLPPDFPTATQVSLRPDYKAPGR